MFSLQQKHRNNTGWPTTYQ